MRSLSRAAALLSALLEDLAAFALFWLRHGGRLTLRQRAEWLCRSCRRVTRRLGLPTRISGAPLPSHGLVVSNHLSYFDILLYGAAMPCVFVSKKEVRSWPIFGLLAACGGTIFLDRARTSDVHSAASRVRAALQAGLPVLLFPEGTSTDGSEVLRFHSSLFDPAVATDQPVTAAAVAYAASDASESDLCYYGDISFGPHLLETLGRHGLRAELRFAPPLLYADRRMAASGSRDEVIRLRGELRQQDQTDAARLQGAGSE